MLVKDASELVGNTPLVEVSRFAKEYVVKANVSTVINTACNVLNEYVHSVGVFGRLSIHSVSISNAYTVNVYLYDSVCLAIISQVCKTVFGVIVDFKAEIVPGIRIKLHALIVNVVTAIKHDLAISVNIHEQSTIELFEIEAD